MSATPEKMTIDSHQHFWKYEKTRGGWITDKMALLRRDFLPEEYEGECARNGIDGSIAVQVDQSESETLFLLGLAESNHRIAGVVGWADLCSPQIPAGSTRHELLIRRASAALASRPGLPADEE